MTWDESDIEMSDEPLEDYSFATAQDNNSPSLLFLGTWSPATALLDDGLTPRDVAVALSSDLPHIGTFTRASASRTVPNGEAWLDISVRIAKGSTPVSGMLVNFSVEPLRPKDGWRNVDELAQRMKTNASEFRNRVASGRIRLVGTMSPRKAYTDSDGIAVSRYIVSNIGGNQNQIATERVVMSSAAGVDRHEIAIGYDFSSVPTVPRGLRIARGTTGRHCQKDLAAFLSNLGSKVAQGNWPHPVTVTAASLRWGGLYPPHLSHQHGATLDLRPMSTDGLPTWCRTNGKHNSNYDRERTRKLVLALKHSGATKMFFNDPELRAAGATPWPAHDNHIHVSWIRKSALLANLSVNGLESLTEDV